MQEPDDAQYGGLLNLLKQIHLFEKMDARDALVSALPASLRGQLTRSGSVWRDLENITVECARWGLLASGEDPLVILAQRAAEMVEGSTFELHLRNWIKVYDQRPEITLVSAPTPQRVVESILDGIPDQQVVDAIPGLTPEDSLVLKIIGLYVIGKNSTQAIDRDAILTESMSLGISKGDALDSLEVLSNNGFVESKSPLGVRAYRMFSLTISGFETFLQAYELNYQSLVLEIETLIVNEGETISSSIASRVQRPFVLVAHVLKILERRKLILLSRNIGAPLAIRHTTPELKRIIQKSNKQNVE